MASKHTYYIPALNKVFGELSNNNEICSLLIDTYWKKFPPETIQISYPCKECNSTVKIDHKKQIPSCNGTAVFIDDNGELQFNIIFAKEIDNKLKYAVESITDLDVIEKAGSVLLD